MKGNPDAIKVLNEVLRAHRRQSVSHPRENVQELGLCRARRTRLE